MKLTRDRRESLWDFIIQSDEIEGYYDNPAVIEQQLVGQVKTGHVGAMLGLEALARDKRKRMSLYCILKIQAKIIREQYAKHGLKPLDYCCGRLRIIGVSVGGRECPLSNEVPAGMNKLVQDIRKWQDKAHKMTLSENSSFIALVHWRFEMLHPFVDGNGRTGRALAYYMMRFAGIEPFVFTAGDKNESYYPCFVQDDGRLMRDYMKGRVELTNRGKTKRG